MTEFALNNRIIYRTNGRLSLADGTLAGANLDMASLYPAQLLKRTAKIGRLGRGTRADFLHLDEGHNIKSVWRGGVKSALN